MEEKVPSTAPPIPSRKMTQPRRAKQSSLSSFWSRKIKLTPPKKHKFLS